jgi:hypothetical protein
VFLDLIVVATTYRCDFFSCSPENEGVDASDSASAEDEDFGHSIR